tara:strand:- start:341 stop:514 length:174 start_codon:yes stop_codon:yes gene_type:complete
MSLLIIICILWEIYWKAYALWMAAQKNDKAYFIAILIINSLGALPIYYLYKNNFFRK